MRYLSKFYIAFVLVLSLALADNPRITSLVKSLETSGSWKTQSNESNKLQKDDLLLQYNGASDFPLNSGHSVGEAKTFARIIVSAECGYDLPAGFDYATHPISKVEAGDVLQKKAPGPHTMLVIEVKAEEVKVVHANWSAYHRVCKSNFSKKWLKENGFKVFKPGKDKVKNTIEPVKKQSKGDVKGQALGTWRVVVTGTIPYWRRSMGTIVSHSGPGGQIRVNEERTVSNTFSVEAGVSSDVISAKVGFSVTSSFSRSLQYWRDVSPGKYGYVDLYYKYMVKNFDVYYKPLFGSEYFVSSGKAYKWQAVEFQYRETNN